MERFNGFSQDEINRVTTAADKKTISSGDKMGQRGQHQGIRRMPDKWSMENNNNNSNNNNIKSKQQQQLQSAKTSNSNKTTRTNLAKIESKSLTPTPTIETFNSLNTNENSTINSEESLSRSMSKSIEEALFYQPLKILAMNGQTQRDHQSHPQQDQQRKDVEETVEDDMHIDIEMSEDSHQEADSTTLDSTGQQGSSLPLDSKFKGLSLKEFEVHRRMVEEQNKQKKQLLCKAIERHSQKTAAETRKIEEIKVELAKLDNELAADVAILRKQIDTACIHFSNIEKHYMKIEAQFLKAKMELHQASEKKELLTEHLCTVIAHNEDRKAEKLSELMHKVGISPTGEIQTEDS